MKKIKIGVQGARGSFSEEAALHFSKNYGFENVEIVYLISSESVLENLQLEAIEYGVFAMENAQGGVVIESIEALAKYQCKIIELPKNMGPAFARNKGAEIAENDILFFVVMVLYPFH